jgi:hypothetical protein|tara:strand:- start:11470 stop:11775 length:306 start_codon:yes stop_codon:yes gene_type:complete
MFHAILKIMSKTFKFSKEGEQYFDRDDLVELNFRLKELIHDYPSLPTEVIALSLIESGTKTLFNEVGPQQTLLELIGITYSTAQWGNVIGGERFPTKHGLN